MEIASIYFGLFLGLLVSTLTKVVQQTRSIWKRTRSLSNIYLYMIWIEAIVNLIFSLTTYLYLRGVIPSSLVYYFGVVTLWAIQTQLLSQIIANRVALIMVNRSKSRLLKWSLFILTAVVNIAVYCIWIPAHLPSASPKMILLNNIWERIEKSFFLLVDFGLNLFFLYLLRYRLIADGLTNYVQFAPVAYIVKLHIELTMADLISKVVRSGSTERHADGYASGNHTSSRTHPSNRTAAKSTRPQSDGYFTGSVGMDTNISGGKTDGGRYEDYGAGIRKTVTTVVKSDSSEDGSEEYPVRAKRLTGDFSSTKSICAEGSISR